MITRVGVFPYVKCESISKIWFVLCLNVSLYVGPQLVFVHISTTSSPFEDFKDKYMIV